MNTPIVSMPAMTVVGTELRTTFMNNECYSAIPAFWQEQRINHSIKKIPHKLFSHDVVLGVYTNYTPGFSLTQGYYSLIIGCPVTMVSSISSGMVVKEIPESKYAVFIAKGPFSSALGKAWMDIWQNKTLERTFTNDFEWYDEQSTDDESSIVKIYIAIK